MVLLLRTTAREEPEVAQAVRLQCTAAPKAALQRQHEAGPEAKRRQRPASGNVRTTKSRAMGNEQSANAGPNDADAQRQRARGDLAARPESAAGQYSKKARGRSETPFPSAKAARKTPPRMRKRRRAPHDARNAQALHDAQRRGVPSVPAGVRRHAISQGALHAQRAGIGRAGSGSVSFGTPARCAGSAWRLCRRRRRRARPRRLPR